MQLTSGQFRDFCFWLQGFLDHNGSDSISFDDAEVIRLNLKEVVTPPSMDDDDD